MDNCSVSSWCSPILFNINPTTLSRRIRAPPFAFFSYTALSTTADSLFFGMLAVSSTNFRSIFIFASCVVGSCNILYEWVFIRRGPISCFTIMVSVGIFTSGGNFEIDLTSHVFYKFITVVYSILLYQMYGRRFIMFFLPPGFNIGRSTNKERY